MEQLSLQPGQAASIEMLFTSESDLVEKVKELYVTLDGSGRREILPKGVRAEFKPSNFTIPPHGNVSVIHTITVDQDAPIGAYYVHTTFTYTTPGGDGGVLGNTIWLVIGPSKPYHGSGNFSLAAGSDDIAAYDELNITDMAMAGQKEIWEFDFHIRSEGPPLNVTLELVNINVPEEVRLYLTNLKGNQVFVSVGSQWLVIVQAIVPWNTQPGKYRFQVIARSGNETHTCNFDLLIKKWEKPDETPSTSALSISLFMVIIVIDIIVSIKILKKIWVNRM